MTYNFQGYAIKCNTWQQMQQLKEIAERQDKTTQKWAYSKDLFDKGYCYFVTHNYLYFCSDHKLSTETEISFTSFITSHPDYRADGC